MQTRVFSVTRLFGYFFGDHVAFAATRQVKKVTNHFGKHDHFLF